MCLAKKKPSKLAFQYLYVIFRWKDLDFFFIYSPETPFKILLKNVVMQEIGQPHSLV